MKLTVIDLKLQAKLKVSIMIPPTLWPSAAWGSQQWTILCSTGSSGEWGPEWGWPGQGAQARPWLPALASTQKYLSKPILVTVHPQEPQAAEGLRAGGIIMATFSFAFTLSSTSISSMMKCLRYFLL